MNATLSLTLVIFCHIYRPHPHGITVVSVPITTVLPLTLSPFPRYYRSFHPHYRGFTAVNADLPLSRSPCSSLMCSEAMTQNKQLTAVSLTSSLSTPVNPSDPLNTH